MKREIGFLYRKIVFFFQSQFALFAVIVAIGLGFCYFDKNYILPLIYRSSLLTGVHDFMVSYLSVFQNLPVVGAIFRISWVTPHTYYVIGGVYGAIVGGYYVLMLLFNRRELWLNIQLIGLRKNLTEKTKDKIKHEVDENGNEKITEINAYAEKMANRLVRRIYGLIDDDGRRVVIVPAGRSVDVMAVMKRRCEEHYVGWVNGNLKGDWPTDYTVEHAWLGEFYTITEKTSHKKEKNTQATITE